jgi:hypothetical protein
MLKEAVGASAKRERIEASDCDVGDALAVSGGGGGGEDVRCV